MKKRSTVLLAGILSIGCMGNPVMKMEETVLAAPKYEKMEIDADKLPGLPEGINSPSLNDTGNIINGYEYYINDDRFIARKKTDGSEDTVIYKEAPCSGVWAMEEGVIFTSLQALYFCDPDGKNVQIIDEELPQDYDDSGRGYVIEDGYIRGYDLYGEDVVWYDRDTLEKVEIADFLKIAEVLLIADDKVYYYGVGGNDQEDIVNCCNLDGSDNIPLMILPDNFGYNFSANQTTVVDGDLFMGFSDDRKLYKFPAGTSVASEEMYINDSESGEIFGYHIRDNVIYCTDGWGKDVFFKIDLDGNDLGSCSEEEWDKSKGR